MESDFNRLKKIMSEEGNAVPPGFEWEANKDAIFAKMKAMEAEKAPKKRLFRIIVMVLLLISISTCTAIVFQRDNQTYAEQLPEEAGSAAVPEQMNTETMAEKSVANSKAEDAIENQIKEPALNAAELAANAAASSNVVSSNVTSNAGSSNTVSSNEKLGISEKTGDLSAVEAEAKNRVMTSQNSNISPFDSRDEALAMDHPEQIHTPDNMDIASSLLPEMAPIDALTNPGIHTAPNNRIDLPGIQDNSIQKDLSQKSGWLSFSSGISFWNEGYGPSSSPERAAYERALPSYFGRLSYQHVSRKGWIFSTGIQYVRLASEFERTFDIEGYKIVLKDTIIKVNTNSLTGEHRTIRGDKELEVPATRRVRHYNSIQIVQLPIEFGKSWSGRRFGAEITGGPIFNFYSQRQGRTSVNDELWIYNGSGSPIFNNKLHVSAMVASRIQYHLTPMVDLSLGIQYQQSVGNWSGETGIRMRPQVFIGEIGIRYRMF